MDLHDLESIQPLLHLNTAAQDRGDSRSLGITRMRWHYARIHATIMSTPSSYKSALLIAWTDVNLCLLFNYGCIPYQFFLFISVAGHCFTDSKLMLIIEAVGDLDGITFPALRGIHTIIMSTSSSY